VYLFNHYCFLQGLVKAVGVGLVARAHLVDEVAVVMMVAREEEAGEGMEGVRVVEGTMVEVDMVVGAVIVKQLSCLNSLSVCYKSHSLGQQPS
jgi:hypothetical protein